MYVEFVDQAGGLACNMTDSSRSTIHPLDTLKVRIQTGKNKGVRFILHDVRA